MLTVHSVGPWNSAVQNRRISRRLTITLRAVTNELIERAPAIGRDVLKLKEKTSRELEKEAKHGNYQQCRRLVLLKLYRY